MADPRLAMQAENWTNFVTASCAKDIDWSIQHSLVVHDAKVPNVANISRVYGTTETCIVKMGSEVAHRQFEDSGYHTCTLNFASYKNPGGGFIRGQFAQEEALCHASTLYPVLSHFKYEYDSRLKKLNNGLYNEDFIYSPRVRFLQMGIMELIGNYHTDVLTYAAPNMFRKSKDNPLYLPTLEKRMEIAYLIPRVQGANVLILGAWGCGVFMNDTELIAYNWKKLTQKYDGLYKVVVHPIPDQRNFNKFQQVYYS